MRLSLRYRFSFINAKNTNDTNEKQHMKTVKRPLRSEVASQQLNS